MNQFPSKNYFTLPNEIFSLGLGAGEIAVYAYLRCLENPSTYQCWPSYATIGKAIGRTKNTVMQYVDALSEKGLISTEPTSVLTKSRIKKNGNLRYTIHSVHMFKLAHITDNEFFIIITIKVAIVHAYIFGRLTGHIRGHHILPIHLCFISSR